MKGNYTIRIALWQDRSGIVQNDLVCEGIEDHMESAVVSSSLLDICVDFSESPKEFWILSAVDQKQLPRRKHLTWVLYEELGICCILKNRDRMIEVEISGKMGRVGKSTEMENMLVVSWSLTNTMAKV